jgi:putative chitinase
MITLELLRRVYSSCPAERLEHFLAPLQAACEAAEINTRPRLAAFLAQAGVESDELRHVEENLRYSARRLVEVFPRHFPTIEAAEAVAGKPEAIANRVYANKGGNGDEASGDGWRYRGRGIFQVTLRDNYARCSRALCGDNAATLLENPDWLTDPDYACMSAAWYWGEHNLNRWADLGDLETLTAEINRAKLGMPERVALYRRGIAALQLA